MRSGICNLTVLRRAVLVEGKSQVRIEEYALVLLPSPSSATAAASGISFFDSRHSTLHGSDANTAAIDFFCSTSAQKVLTPQVLKLEAGANAKKDFLCQPVQMSHCDGREVFAPNWEKRRASLA